MRCRDSPHSNISHTIQGIDYRLHTLKLFGGIGLSTHYTVVLLIRRNVEGEEKSIWVIGVCDVGNKGLDLILCCKHGDCDGTR